VDTLWQIDPFGSSALSPLLFGETYKYAVLNRIGDSNKNQMMKDRNVDFVWKNPLDESKNITTHVLSTHYGTP
jgi:hypothetical protein